MDQQLFDKLDDFERGALFLSPRTRHGQGYEDPTHPPPWSSQDRHGTHSDSYPRSADRYASTYGANEPMIFDHQLLSQHSGLQESWPSSQTPRREAVPYSSSHFQQSLGQSEFSLHSTPPPSPSSLVHARPHIAASNAFSPDRRQSTGAATRDFRRSHPQVQSGFEQVRLLQHVGAPLNGSALPSHVSSTRDHAVPYVQGVPLVPTHRLPDKFRSIFSFPHFNAVQSKSFGVVYQTDDNFVLSAPTGSGKTAVLELAICRLIATSEDDTFKVVYQAPTKSLCSERHRDWQAKFGPLGLQCRELTGDTSIWQLNEVKRAHIIVTTPEKWDSITRKWKDHRKLMELVKLFLIDEVHILKDERGATLEAVVSRMKSFGSSVRFVALSATVPNSHDIAVWLGKDGRSPGIPAPREHLGEEFRPVKLSRNVCGYTCGGNDFAFDGQLTGRLVNDVLPKWSQRKPIMIFCFTRDSCVKTAKALADWSSKQLTNEQYWPSSIPSDFQIEDQELKRARPSLECMVCFC